VRIHCAKIKVAPQACSEKFQKTLSAKHIHKQHKTIKACIPRLKSNTEVIKKDDDETSLSATLEEGSSASRLYILYTH